MLRLFRNLRNSHNQNSGIRKYLFYAIGEIILVVLGILIALQIDNWNEDRINRQKEVILLNQLKREFNGALAQLGDKIEQRNQIMRSSKWLLNLIDSSERNTSDSVSYHLKRTVFVPTLNVNTNDFFDARDVGLIRNDSLRNLLAEWPAQAEQLIEEEQGWSRYRDLYLVPFLFEHYQARNLYNAVQTDLAMMRTVFLDKDKTFQVMIGNSKTTPAVTELLKTPVFEDHLAYSIMINNIANIQSYTLGEHIEKILEQINTSIR
ncbi:DUF6090 family protein [Robiginitalea sp. IMCC43444]|uniref:DUF6090 family protein n=1 Tax=Robiginitalea sp. IMCC43444 TaxID=3459121 RepID=UPI004042F924